HQLTSVHYDVVGMVVKWFVTFLLAVIAFAVQRYRPSDFGLGRFHWSDALLGVGGFVIALVVTGAVSGVVTMPNSLSQLQKIAALPLSLRIAVVCTAACCEEFIFRGFAIEELASLVRHRWLAGLLSLILFTLGHIGLYGLSAALLIPCIVGAILTGLYLWRHSLFSCIVMHLFMDGFLIVVVPSFVHAR
ncbi:MAG: CPBP family intramembrane glutamic endopeptidase, partial [Acidobacteriaceae bacterium]